MSSILPTTSNPASSTAGAVSSAINNGTIAGNFTTFLQLLTTQLKNQNPLDPLDTNQFTQQLVEFAQVEQQLKSNDQLSTLVSLQQSAQATSALGLVGATVVVNGQTAQLANGSANWTLSATKPTTATISIADSTGQTAYTGKFSVNAGSQPFTWNGQGNDGKMWPAGNYTLTATGVDANGQPSVISTQVQAPVDSVDLSQNPPLLSINGQNYLMSQIQKIVRSGL
jgi:flagellar basal-body rod modification protein FlgD